MAGRLRAAGVTAGPMSQLLGVVALSSTLGVVDAQGSTSSGAIAGIVVAVIVVLGVLVAVWWTRQRRQREAPPSDVESKPSDEPPAPRKYTPPTRDYGARHKSNPAAGSFGSIKNGTNGGLGQADLRASSSNLVVGMDSGSYEQPMPGQLSSASGLEDSGAYEKLGADHIVGKSSAVSKDSSISGHAYEEVDALDPRASGSYPRRSVSEEDGGAYVSLGKHTVYKGRSLRIRADHFRTSTGSYGRKSGALAPEDSQTLDDENDGDYEPLAAHTMYRGPTVRFQHGTKFGEDLKEEGGDYEPLAAHTVYRGPTIRDHPSSKPGQQADDFGIIHQTPRPSDSGDYEPLAAHKMYRGPTVRFQHATDQDGRASSTAPASAPRDSTLSTMSEDGGGDYEALGGGHIVYHGKSVRAREKFRITSQSSFDDLPGQVRVVRSSVV